MTGVTLNKNQSQSNTFSTKKAIYNTKRALISADTDAGPDNRRAIFMSKFHYVPQMHSLLLK